MAALAFPLVRSYPSHKVYALYVQYIKWTVFYDGSWEMLALMDSKY